MLLEPAAKLGRGRLGRGRHHCLDGNSCPLVTGTSEDCSTECWRAARGTAFRGSVDVLCSSRPLQSHGCDDAGAQVVDAGATGAQQAGSEGDVFRKNDPSNLRVMNAARAYLRMKKEAPEMVDRLRALSRMCRTETQELRASRGLRSRGPRSTVDHGVIVFGGPKSGPPVDDRRSGFALGGSSGSPIRRIGSSTSPIGVLATLGV